MILYAESSAVLSWLLGEPDAADVRDALAGAELVLGSPLTVVECERVLVRAVVTGRIDEGAAADRRGRLRTAMGHWTLLELTQEVMERASRPFPAEPIRTLDALHLAWSLFARSVVPGTILLSRDARIRESAAGLGLALLPD